jgi:hypothetical protein
MTNKIILKLNRVSIRSWTILVSLLIVSFFLGLSIKHPILIQVIGGFLEDFGLVESGRKDSARFLGFNESCIVHLNKKHLGNARCFLEKKDFSGNPNRRVILYVGDYESLDFGSPYLIINLKSGEAGRPANASNLDYDLLFQRILVQSKEGGFMAYDNPLALCGEDSHVQQSDKKIEFIIPCGSPKISGAKVIVQLSY